MTGTDDPWRDIKVPREENSLNVRRADVEHSLDYWFGRDIRGRYILCFDSDAGAPAATLVPKPAGIEVNTLTLGERSCRLVLTLLESKQFDIFRALCFDLMRSTAELSGNDSSAALSITLNRLGHWQSLLQKARDDLLTTSRIIGLVGELLVLRDILLPRMNIFDAVQSWRGAYGDEQDFLLAGRIIEVKTQLSTSDRYLPVSSEEQLDTEAGPVLICYQTLDVPADEAGGAVSLNGLVSSLSGPMADNDHAAADLFQTALLEAGYRWRDEYDRPCWLLNGRSFYEVGDGFPRITPGMISGGIDRVRYRIAVQACTEFEIGEEAAMRRALNG
ncbi:MAG: PD-(D/E)XK motif protein [Rhodospirillaceae bacterium]|nr:PD-(D/E)XK motif protein [Rhodospirillaceae bacterium]